MKSQTSRSENEPRWFVYRGRLDMPWYCWLADEAQASVNTPHSHDPEVVAALRDDGYEVIEVVAASRLEAAEGERDRLREAPIEALKAAAGRFPDNVAQKVTFAVAIDILRAALSTGDRQEQHFGVRTVAPTQPGQAGHETDGGAS